ncbi:CD209 antigen-like protein 2 isoform X2 [Ascaphus truei]|uniref:CD209 antigen-like protein 2 isoform X2 n=1 Tax=Ascaphus truei TaxID=8439 RepID=UPI003F5A3835
MDSDNHYQDLEFQDRNIYSVMDKTKDQKSLEERKLKKVTRSMLIWRIISIGAVTLIILLIAVGSYLFLIKMNYPTCPERITVDNETQLLKVSTEYRCEYCSENWILFSRKCYFLSLNLMNQTGSTGNCKKMGSFLTKIQNTEEESFLESQLKGSAWIGLTKKNDDWFWEDGSILGPYSASFWIQSQPDNTGGRENCATLSVSSRHKGWNDDSCTREKRYICEKETATAIFH